MTKFMDENALLNITMNCYECLENAQGVLKLLLFSDTLNLENEIAKKIVLDNIKQAQIFILDIQNRLQN